MADGHDEKQALGTWNTPQIAEIDGALGSLSYRARVVVTPAGLIAIGLLVSSILLSTTAVVAVSRSRRQTLPLRFKRR